MQFLKTCGTPSRNKQLLLSTVHSRYFSKVRPGIHQVTPVFGNNTQRKDDSNTTLRKIGNGKVVRVPRKVKLGKGLSARVVFEDKNLLIVNKPAGVLTQGDITGDLDLVTACVEYLTQQQRSEAMGGDETIEKDFELESEVFETPYLGVLQRLDRPVSGLVMFGKTKIATKRMAKQFQNNEVVKDYMAIVQGDVKGSGYISGGGSFAEYWSRKGWRKNSYTPAESHTDAAGSNTPDKGLHWAAQSQVSVLKAKDAFDMTVLSVRPESGKKHQIRRQLATMGHPIVGDTLYKSEIPTDNGSILLHAYQLEFTYPMMRRPQDPKNSKPKKRKMRVVSLIPDEWKSQVGNIEIPQVARGEKMYMDYTTLHSVT